MEIQVKVPVICRHQDWGYLNILKPMRAEANGARYPLEILTFLIVDFALI